MKKDARTLEASSALLIIAALVLAPFIGGKEELAGMAALSILVLAASVLLLWSRQFARPGALWPFAAFVGLIAASAINTASLHATIQQTLYFAACAAAALVASSAARTSRWLVGAAFAFASAGLLLSLMAAWEYRGSGAGWRVFGTFLNPGFFGGYLVMVLPITLAVFLASRSPIILAAAGVSWGLELAALLLTGTRFAVASAFGAILVFAVLALWTRSLGRRQFVWFGVAIAIASVAVGASFAPTAARLGSKAAAEQAHSGPFRIATWKGTAKIIRAHPILGTGAGTFELVFPRYMVAGYTRNAHSGYLQIAAEAGIPALIAAGAAFGALVLAGIRGLRREDEERLSFLLPDGVTLLVCAAIAALAGSLARNLLDSDIYNPGIGLPFWILAGLVAARAPARQPATAPTAARIALSALAGAMALVWSLFVIGQVRSDAAMEAWRNGDPLSAVEMLRSAVAVDPLSGDHWLKLGQIEAMSPDEDQRKEGIAHIRRAARLEPTRARNPIVLGEVLAAQGDTQGAIDAYRRALAVDPHATRAMLAAARLLKGNEADDMYRRLLDEEKSPVERLRGVPELVNPDYAWAHYYFGQKEMNSGHWEKAAEHFRAAVNRLELRKSYKMIREAAEAAGMVDPEEEQALDQLLADSKAALAKAMSLNHKKQTRGSLWVR